MHKLLCIILSLLMLLSIALVGCDQKEDEQPEGAYVIDEESLKEITDWARAYLNGFEEKGQFAVAFSSMSYYRNMMEIRLSQYKKGSKEWKAELEELLRYQDQLKEERGWLLEEESKYAYILPTYDCFNQVNGYIYEYRPDRKCVGYFQVLNIGFHCYLDIAEEGHPAFGCIKKLSCFRNYDEKLYYLGEGKYYLRDKEGYYVSCDGEEKLTVFQAEIKYSKCMFEKYEDFSASLATPIQVYVPDVGSEGSAPTIRDENSEYVRNEIAIACSQYKVGSAEWKACWEQPLLAKIDELAEDPQYAWLKTEGSELSELKFLHDCFGQIGGVLCEIRLDGECLGYIQLLNVGDQYFVDAVVQGDHPSCGCLKDFPVWWNDENRLYYFGYGKYYTPSWSGHYDLYPEPEFVLGVTYYDSRGEATARRDYSQYISGKYGVSIFVEESSEESQ